MMQLLKQLVALSFDAADEVQAIYLGDIETSIKSDGSPLTKADLRAHSIICQGLKQLSPNTTVISEESFIPNSEMDYEQDFFLVDPLDGTKEFINKNGEFTINIALIKDGQPILGVVNCPALNVCYAGLVGENAYKIDNTNHWQKIDSRTPSEQGLIITGSRSHNDPEKMDAFLDGKKVDKFIPAGSSLKFCRIAEGLADLYPRLGRTMEWDTAAGQAVLMAAGGSVETLSGAPLAYGKNGLLENPHFLAKSRYLADLS